MEGLELIKIRNLNDKIDFSEREEKFNIKIPPLFKLFHTLFDVTKINTDFLYWKEKNINYPINGLVYKGILNVDNKFSFEEFLKPQNLFIIYEDFFEYEDDEWGLCERKFIPFGVSGVYNNAGGFMVGTVGDECDKIFIDLEDEKDHERFQMIEKNIFDFVRNLELQEIDLSYVSPDIKLKNLYKNWGEDFWRIKEEKEKS